MENNNVKKSNKGLIILIVLLILIVLGLSGYIVYDKFITKDEVKDNAPTNKESKEVSITKAQATNYLKYVPIAPERDLDESGIKNDNEYGLNAYSGVNMTIDSYSEKLLLAMAYKEIEINEEPKEKVEAEMCGDVKTCYGVSYATIDDMNIQIKKMYNLDNISIDKFSYPGGQVEKSEKYWVKFLGRGSSSIRKISKLINYYIDDDNNLIISEKAAFVIDEEPISGNSYLYKFSNESNKISETSIKMNDDSSVSKELFENNLDKLAIFTHTFKLGKDNNFYYYSTSIN